MRVWGMHERTQIKLSATDRAALKAVVANRNSPQKHVWRAKIVLLTAAGHGTAEIMRQTGKAKTVIWRWQERFGSEGAAGLWRDKTRPSRIPPLSPNIAERVVALTLAGPPAHATHWTGAAMAKAVGISVSSVQRIWRAHGLQPHRMRQFKLYNDPQFVAKLRDIVGLYVNPPDHAVVLSVDEKSQIQARDRTQPGLPMKKGQAATMTHDYKRARRQSHRPVHEASSPSGVHPLLEPHRRQSAYAIDRPRHRRQLRRAQASQGPGMARSPPALCLPLHSDLGILAQCCRRSVRAPRQARRVSFAQGTHGRNPQLHRRYQCQPKAIYLDKRPWQDHRRRQTRAPSVRFDPLDAMEPNSLTAELKTQ